MALTDLPPEALAGRRLPRGAFRSRMRITSGGPPRWYERPFLRYHTAVSPGSLWPSSRAGKLLLAPVALVIAIVAVPVILLTGATARLVALPFLCVDRLLRRAGVLPAVYEGETSLVERISLTLLVAAALDGEVRLAPSGTLLVGHRREEGPKLSAEAARAASQALLKRFERHGGTVMLGLPAGASTDYHEISMREEEGALLLAGRRTTAPQDRATDVGDA